MYRIALINMPLANLAAPSIALTQIKEVVRRNHGDRAEVKIHYLNQDFARYLTVPAYGNINSFAHHPMGLGEWFFRQVAFPDQPDNADDYFQRYYPQHDARNRMIREFVLKRREGLETHFNDMIDKYELDRQDMVGFTSMFSQNVASLGMARLIKARNPAVTVVLGGANCEAPMGREVIDHSTAVDYVFSGPALKSFPELLGCLLEGDEAGAHRINGVLSRGNSVQPAGCASTDGGMVPMGGTNVVRGMGDELPINEFVELDYTEFLDDYEKAFPVDRPPATLFFETSRGCWWGERAHCTFCGLNGSTMSYRSLKPEFAIRLMSSLFEHQSRSSHLASVDNILPKSYITEVLPFLDTPTNMSLFYEVKADLSEGDFAALRNARVLDIQPGIESLNTSTLKLMRKGTSAFQNVLFLLNSVRFKIHPAWNLLIGFPREEIEVYEKYLDDIPLLAHLPPPTGVHPVRFDRYSPYFAEADDYGLDLQPLDWYALTYPYPKDSLKNLAYYFADHNYGAQYAANTARMIMKLRQKVERWTALWKQSEQRPRLHLRERDGATVVFDSRSGVPVEHVLSDAGLELLAALVTPKKVVNLRTELPLVDVEGELEALTEKGLVFHELERYMSLVERWHPINRVGELAGATATAAGPGFASLAGVGPSITPLRN
ncbi:MAG TPA: RiPP maturation radical SAM C-methyltransferase [Longimicrobium sp.]|nr:RiPP maturation radical SAM C-methyltransferase [Longimicrobium sp.]